MGWRFRAVNRFKLRTVGGLDEERKIKIYKHMSDIPSILPTIIIGDDALLIAQISSIIARKNYYTPVVDGPRIQRPDASAEVVRRNNAAAHVKPEKIIFAGVPEATCNLFKGRFPDKKTFRISSIEEFRPLYNGKIIKNVPLQWGRENIALGLLNALRGGREIVFGDYESPRQPILSETGHLVVCEDDEPLSQIIAANYAYAINAGLCLITAVRETDADKILDDFYSVYDQRERSQTEELERLKNLLRSLAGNLPIAKGGALTFITGRLPWGFAFSEVPSTHLFKYPDLGIAIINGVAAEQPGSPGVRIAAMIDPSASPAKDIEFSIEALTRRGMFAKVCSSSAATVRNVSRLLYWFPYNLLLISTHCGDSSGYRWTYQFTDSEGIDRVLVVDLAIGIEIVPGAEKLRVTRFDRFASLDGIDWNDPEKSTKLKVDKAIIDYVERSKDMDSFQPTKKEQIGRIYWSSALQMHDGNLIVVSATFACNGSPIILNNACASWHRLAGDFMFGNARAYLGTLFSVVEAEAQRIMELLVDRYHGKYLSVALWRAQNDVYQDNVRRPYILCGCHFQRLRTTRANVPLQIFRKLLSALAEWKRRKSELSTSSEEWLIKDISENISYLEKEIAGIRKRWLVDNKDHGRVVKKYDD